MKVKFIFFIFLFALLIVNLPLSILESQSVVNTVHNLSVSGPGNVKASSEQEVCVFCHTPHNSNPIAPLWNRSIPGSTYTIYKSSTQKAVIGQPDGSSILCLSCHDGTIALGNLVNSSSDISFASGITTMPSGKTNLTTDLSNDHPISFTYDAALANADGQLFDPAGLPQQIQLENGKLQCTSCHDAHSNGNTKFLVETTQGSQLCLFCHNVKLWTNSSHKLSTKTWNGAATNPWLHTTYNTVSDNACENCHMPHTAGGKIRLRNYTVEENNCLNCHNGNVAATNILAQLSKTYRHNVFNYTNIHDPTENALASNIHDECEDCHNPHSVTNTTASAPYVKGYCANVKGIDQSGNPVNSVQYQYEICYRCHADSPNKPAPTINRQLVQNNVRFEFDLSNPSYHPIVGPGKSTIVPGLISPLTTSSIIYCTDCHSSDGIGSPQGPHGSIYPSILKLQYNTIDRTTESVATYALCYSCHDRTTLLSSSSSFRYHNFHVVGQRTPCTTCHDSHGISSTQGNTTNNTHLINFNIAVVSQYLGVMKFVDGAPGTRYCQLSCHGEEHNTGKSF